MIYLIAISVIIVGFLLIVAVMYNHLVKRKTMMEEGWSGIDVQLKKRYNLIPNLVETVKGYATHERDTLEKVIAARNKAIQADNVGDKTQAENELNSALANIFALGEAYPDLKANTNFLELQRELSSIEGDIEKARRYYNGTVRANNIAVKSFPNNIIAGMFGFFEGEFFELIDSAQRDNIEVRF
jgi:LemA protein